MLPVEVFQYIIKLTKEDILELEKKDQDDDYTWRFAPKSKRGQIVYKEKGWRWMSYKC